MLVRSHEGTMSTGVIRHPGWLPCCGALLTALICLFGACDAWAAPSVQVQHLCTHAATACSIQVPGELREGSSVGILVTGRADTTVSISTFRLTVTAGTATAITPLGNPVDVHTDSRGFGRGDLVYPAPVAGQAAGWVLVAPSDVTWQPSQIVGATSSFGTRRPTILGDGYGTRKPVNSSLDLQITNAIVGTRFAVEYLADDGSWHSVSTRTNNIVGTGSGITHLPYVVPQGLLPRPYTFRLFNITDPSSAPQEWQVVPSVTAPAQPRMPLMRTPRLGTGIATASVVPHHPRHAVLGLLACLTVLVGAAVVVWPSMTLSRRPVVARSQRTGGQP